MFPQPNAVAIAMPANSPIAQPVRQWVVALRARRFRLSPAPPAAAAAVSIWLPTVPGARGPAEAPQQLLVAVRQQPPALAMLVPDVDPDVHHAADPAYQRDRGAGAGAFGQHL